MGFYTINCIKFILLLLISLNINESNNSRSQIDPVNIYRTNDDFSSRFSIEKLNVIYDITKSILFIEKNMDPERFREHHLPAYQNMSEV